MMKLEKKFSKQVKSETLSSCVSVTFFSLRCLIISVTFFSLRCQTLMLVYVLV